MSNVFDYYFAYKFLRLLTKDWKDTPAFKLGIIDDKGVKLRDPVTDGENAAYDIFDRLVFNIKRLLQKTPLTRTTLAHYATALYLLKEETKLEDHQFEALLEVFSRYTNFDLNMLNEEIENNAGGGNIAKPDLPMGTPPKKFCGTPVFEVDDQTYSKCINHKNPRARWSKYVDVESELGASIRDFAKSNYQNHIIIQHNSTGAMRYLRRK